MLDVDDKKYISDQMKENNKELIGALGELLEQNILPRLDGVEAGLAGVNQRLDGVEKRLGGLEKRMDTIEGTVANLPTKQYLDDKLADAVSDTVRLIDKRFELRDKVDQKFKTTVTEVIEEHNLATPSQLSNLKQNIGFGSPVTAQSV